MIDLEATSADDAVELAWKAYGKGGWPLEMRREVPGRDGWSDATAYAYRISPNEKREALSIGPAVVLTSAIGAGVAIVGGVLVGAGVAMGDS